MSKKLTDSIRFIIQVIIAMLMSSNSSDVKIPLNMMKCDILYEFVESWVASLEIVGISLHLQNYV